MLNLEIQHEQKADWGIQHRELNNVTYLVKDEREKEKKGENKKNREKKKRREGKEKRKGWRLLKKKRKIER